MRNLRAIEHRLPIREHQMQADVQLWQMLGAPNGIGCGRRRDHETRRRQHSANGGDLDGFVDCFMQSKIICRDDEIFVWSQLGR